jgi:hypothetical protein
MRSLELPNLLRDDFVSLVLHLKHNNPQVLNIINSRAAQTENPTLFIQGALELYGAFLDRLPPAPGGIGSVSSL